MKTPQANLSSSLHHVLLLSYTLLSSTDKYADVKRLIKEGNEEETSLLL